MALRVLITVDVEPSIGGAFADPRLRPVGAERRVFCRIDGRDHGIGLIMDVLEAHGLRGTFFVEALSAHYFGQQELAGVCRAVLERNHEVQLHLHPCWLRFEGRGGRPVRWLPDDLHRYPLGEQRSIIARGLEFMEACGLRPRALRAGNFGADLRTLRAARQLGLELDASLCLRYQGGSCRIPGSLNDLARLEGLWELPLTCFRGWGLRPLDLCGASSLEARLALEAARRVEMRCVCVLLHSFSLVRPADAQYRRLRPNRIVIRRLRRLCRYLAAHPERFRAVTVGELLSDPPLPGPAPVPRVSPLASWLRLLEQLAQRLPCIP